jgi:hypothetical protein
VPTVKLDFPLPLSPLLVSDSDLFDVDYMGSGKGQGIYAGDPCRDSHLDYTVTGFICCTSNMRCGPCGLTSQPEAKLGEAALQAT